MWKLHLVSLFFLSLQIAFSEQRIYKNKIYNGPTLRAIQVANYVTCAGFCDRTPGCVGANYYIRNNVCSMKKKVETSGKNFRTRKDAYLYVKTSEKSNGNVLHTFFRFFTKVNFQCFISCSF